MQSRRQLARLAAALGGVPVWGCLPQSRAQCLGVRYGDIILSVNGQRTHSAEEYVEARQLRAEGAELIVFRDGQEFTVELAFTAERQPITRAQICEAAIRVVTERLLPQK